MADKKMKFSVMFAQGQPLDKAVELWKACEEEGMSMVGVADSPALLRELYVSTTMCVLNTSKVQVITYVTNPISRHPSVTAAAFMTLNELAPGRIGMGIGTGDSAMWGVGLKPARLSRTRDYILTVKGLLRGEEVTWEGSKFKAEWSAWSPPVELPVYVACAGPKVLRMAAEVAEGGLVTMGFSPEDVANIRAIVAEGHAAAGRSDDFDIWWNAHVTFADSVEAARATSLGWSPSWLTMGSLEGKGIPDEYKEKLLQLNVDTHDLEAVYRSPNREVTIVERAKKLGIYDWLMSRSPGLMGTPADVTVRLKELRDRDMLNWIFFATGRGPRASASNAERLELVRTLSRQIMPNL